jgi:hypothetical protein
VCASRQHINEVWHVHGLPSDAAPEHDSQTVDVTVGEDRRPTPTRTAGEGAHQAASVGSCVGGNNTVFSCACAVQVGLMPAAIGHASGWLDVVVWC